MKIGILGLGVVGQTLGWRHVVDLGPISSARGTEMALPLWLRLWGTLSTPLFNFRIVQ